MPDSNIALLFMFIGLTLPSLAWIMNYAFDQFKPSSTKAQDRKNLLRLNDWAVEFNNLDSPIIRPFDLLLEGLNSLPFSVIITNINGRIIFENEKAKKYYLLGPLTVLSHSYNVSTELNKKTNVTFDKLTQECLDQKTEICYKLKLFKEKETFDLTIKPLIHEEDIAIGAMAILTTKRN